MSLQYRSFAAPVHPHDVDPVRIVSENIGQCRNVMPVPSFGVSRHDGTDFRLL
jgi:hypothetical protein